jgi:CubicO group peptidase (beta-lactamase class C family)
MRPIRMKSFLPAVIAMWVTAACVHDQPSFSPAQQAKPVSPFCEKAIRTIDDASPGAAAFVLIGGGEVVCEHFQSGGRHIDGDTVFSTASFSKWITALGVMRLVESGRVDLDAPVSRYLTRWKLPESLYDDDLVTVRRLLSHTAGLTDGLGFGDYRADEILPSLEESLENPRASNGRKAVIAVGQEPGKTFLYSGGGYLILQLMIEEVSGQRFEIFIDDAILKPLGMVRSSFKYIGDIANTSGSFDKEGKPAPQFKYAAAGATAFSSSARDLTRLVRALVVAGASAPISGASLARMREPEAKVAGLPIWGLGTILYAQTRGGDHVFGHDGANDPAINVSVRFNPENGDAPIVLVSGHPSLATDLGAEWVLAETGKPDIFTLMRRR